MSWRLLDIHRYSGIPQRQRRVFLLGLKKGDVWPARGGPAHFPVVWPRPIPCRELSSILDPVSIVADYNMNSLVETSKRRNLARALDIVKKKANRERRHPSRYCVVADLESGQLYDGLEVAPCLKRQCGHLLWSLQHGRVLNLRELCRLQGLDIHEMIVQCKILPVLIWRKCWSMGPHAQ